MDTINHLQALREEMENRTELDTIMISGKSPHPLEKKIIKKIDELVALLTKYEN